MNDTGAVSDVPLAGAVDELQRVAVFHPALQRLLLPFPSSSATSSATSSSFTSRPRKSSTALIVGLAGALLLSLQRFTENTLRRSRDNEVARQTQLTKAIAEAELAFARRETKAAKQDAVVARNQASAEERLARREIRVARQEAQLARDQARDAERQAAAIAGATRGRIDELLPSRTTWSSSSVKSSTNSSLSAASSDCLFPVSVRGKILLLGEGDFTFAVTLARLNRKRGPVRGRYAYIIATSLDGSSVVRAKYGRAVDNLEHLKEDSHVKVMHGVDATQLANWAGAKCERVLWNFPFPVGNRSCSAKEAGALLRGFFSGVSAVLESNGQVQLMVFNNQHKTWGLEAIAAETGFELVETMPMPFGPGVHYEDYQPMREVADEIFPLGKHGEVLRFRPKGGYSVAGPMPPPLRKVKSLPAVTPPPLVDYQALHLASQLNDAKLEKVARKLVERLTELNISRESKSNGWVGVGDPRLQDDCLVGFRKKFGLPVRDLRTKLAGVEWKEDDKLLLLVRLAE
eukprot:CAMPEP_0197577136 /NCGR_PEP_ID=MMETSP1326-20131121/1880_1 /TAXON_ID=1155430 /ORGANISM="Genus nov. species nov., Strain RCC2288" /LENGTH=517 /DNA_ID=CAMNT_0043140155 /DNA_START=56 /DNA_END=1609 /DNA_ORIENTATION=+